MKRDVKHPNVRLKKLREELGLSQRALANRTGVLHSTVHWAEHGYEISLTTAMQLAKALGKTVEEIWSVQ